jgi:hypothetical protein
MQSCITQSLSCTCDNVLYTLAQLRKQTHTHAHAAGRNARALPDIQAYSPSTKVQLHTNTGIHKDNKTFMHISP